MLSLKVGEPQAGVALAPRAAMLDGLMADAERGNLLSEYLTLCRRGDVRAIEAFVERNPGAAASASEWRAAFESGRASAVREPTGEAGSSSAARGSGDPAQEFVARIGRRTRPSERYRVDGEIARGGMGSIHRVWDEDLRRELALKRVLPAAGDLRDASRDSQERTRLARFVEEAQVTGQLAHPGIVPVHELGVDAEGRAYFTMKLVQGVTLEAVFQRVRAGDVDWSRARVLDVLLRVCEAMAYAHAKGVVHRDLKPANVMVGAFGEVHVMDWGLARVVGRDATEADRERGPRAPDAGTNVTSSRAGADAETVSRTLDGDVLGTLAYMSPEQARGRLAEIGPATDVYALGAMLYELLSGHAPHQPPGDRPDVTELWRRVREQRPARLSSADAPPELAAICERAIEADWRRRYADMSALAADLRAFLEGRVVRAYRTGAWAEARKWVERNRALAGALAAGIVAVVAGLVVAIQPRREADASARAARDHAERATGLARLADEKRAEAESSEARAREQQAEAERNAEETKLVADFQTRVLSRLSLPDFGRDVVASMQDEIADAYARGGGDEAAARAAADEFAALVAPVNASNVAQRVLEAQIFGPAVKSIDEGYADRPRIAALLYTPVAEVLRALALYELGERCARAAWEAKRIALGEGHRETLAAQSNLALHLRGLGRNAEAEPLLRGAIAGLEQMTDVERAVLPTLQANLALLVGARGDDVETERLLREALAGQLELFGDENVSTNTTKFNLGQFLQGRGRLQESAPLLREALEFSREAEGDTSITTLTMWNNVALLERSLGDLDAAESLVREGFMKARERWGDAHTVTLSLESTLGLVLSSRGRPAEAEPLFRHALGGLRAVHGDDHVHVQMTQNHLALSLQALGRSAEAEPLARAAYEGLVRLIGAEARDSLIAANFLATVWVKLGRFEETERLLSEVVPIARATLGGDDSFTLTALGNLGATMRAQLRFEPAEPIYRELVERRRRLQGSDHVQTIDAAHDHASCLRRVGGAAEAVPLYREALAWRIARLGPEKELTLRSQTGLGLALQSLGEVDEAETLLGGVLEILSADPGRLPDVAKDAAGGLRDLYRTRHERDPSAGFDARAARIESDWLR